MTFPNQGQSRPYQRITLVLVIAGGLILLIGAMVVAAALHYRLPYIRAFLLPTNAMCPTICERERFIADLAAYSEHPPQRGDIILFAHGSEGPSGLFMKRVIGAAGDNVSGTDGRILVNGSPPPGLSNKETCGKPLLGTRLSTEAVPFESTQVPEGSFFVIGDNLPNSLDSRYSTFGFVQSTQVRGKPLYIYWSPGSSRIGCPIQ